MDEQNAWLFYIARVHLEHMSEMISGAMRHDTCITDGYDRPHMNTPRL